MYICCICFVYLLPIYPYFRVWDAQFTVVFYYGLSIILVVGLRMGYMQQYTRLHMRLSEACNCYEWRMEKHARLSRQRREDLMYIRQCIYLINDVHLLEREVQCYLANIATSVDYWLFKRKHSVLRDMLLMVIMEEKSTRILTSQPVTDREVTTTYPMLLEE